MSVIVHKDIPASKCHAPRVDGESIILEDGLTGESQRARINAVGMQNNEVVLWDGVNDRLKTTGVTLSELSVLDGLTPGSVVGNKAVVVNASRDLTAGTGYRVRNLSLDGTLFVQGVATVNTNLIVGAAVTVGKHVVISGDLSVGFVASNLNLQASRRLRGFYNSGYRNLIYHSDTAEYSFLGDNQDIAAVFLSPKVCVADQANVVWHSGNDGHTSGLDADLLDGHEAAYFEVLGHADTIMASHLASYDHWKIALGYTAYGWGNHAAVGYLLSSTYTPLNILTKIRTVDGHNSGLDADLLDGVQSINFFRKDEALSMTMSYDLSDAYRVSSYRGFSIGSLVFLQWGGYYVQTLGSGAFWPLCPAPYPAYGSICFTACRDGNPNTAVASMVYDGWIWTAPVTVGVWVQGFVCYVRNTLTP